MLNSILSAQEIIGGFMRTHEWSLIFFIVGLLLGLMYSEESNATEPPPYTDMVGKPLSTIECLAVNSYMEGRSESDVANIAIMTTVYARSLLGGRYGDTICEVIFKPYAYSWTNDGLSDRIRDREQYTRLYKLAEDFLTHRDTYLKLFEYIDHYHKVGYKTNWNYRKLDYIGRFDDHIFFRHK
jgi:spore germination cell wall hydrolase CwlJ-like protein